MGVVLILRSTLQELRFGSLPPHFGADLRLVARRAQPAAVPCWPAAPASRNGESGARGPSIPRPGLCPERSIPLNQGIYLI